MTRHRTLVLVAACALAPTLAACGGGSSKPSASSSGGSGGATTIDIKSFSYNDVTVKAGSTVTVKNEDSTVHTVTGTGSGATFDTKDIAGNGTATFTAPAKAGTYDYICSIHNYMKGTLTVT